MALVETTMFHKQPKIQSKLGVQYIITDMKYKPKNKPREFQTTLPVTCSGVVLSFLTCKTR